MWRRKLSAVISNSSASPRRCHDADCTLRTKTSCWVSVGVNARKSCSPRSSGPRRRGSPRRSGAEATTLGRARTATGSAAARSGSGSCARGPRSGRGSRAAASSAATTATSSGSSAFSAPGARSGGGPASTSSETTCPRAWTPVSVRPATPSPDQPGKTLSSAARTSPSTVRSPGCAAQPWKSTPSYSSVSFSRTGAILARSGSDPGHVCSARKRLHVSAGEPSWTRPGSDPGQGASRARPRAPRDWLA